MVGALFWCKGTELVCTTTKVPGPSMVVGG